MNDANIPAVLSRCEQQLRAGTGLDLRAAGFWKAVAQVKRDPQEISRYADRIAAIDHEAFLRRVPLHVHAIVGVAVVALGTLFGIALLWLAAAFQGLTRDVLLLVGMSAVLVCTHGLAHVLVGTFLG